MSLVGHRLSSGHSRAPVHLNVRFGQEFGRVPAHALPCEAAGEGALFHRFGAAESAARVDEAGARVVGTAAGQEDSAGGKAADVGGVEAKAGLARGSLPSRPRAASARAAAARASSSPPSLADRDHWGFLSEWLAFRVLETPALPLGPPNGDANDYIPGSRITRGRHQGHEEMVKTGNAKPRKRVVRLGSREFAFRKWSPRLGLDRRSPD